MVAEAQFGNAASRWPRSRTERRGRSPARVMPVDLMGWYVSDVVKLRVVRTAG
ncbi:MAG: hypothetical protein ACRDXB_14945 [Actinomycetes bacterium]